MTTVADQISTDPLVDFSSAIALPDDLLELRLIRPLSGPKPEIMQKWCRASDIGQYREWLRDRNDEGFNVYVGANPRNAPGATGDDNITLARCVFADFDHCTVDEALVKITAAELPAPTIGNGSGHGYHPYWRLAEAITDLAAWTEIQKNLIALLGSDKSIHNPERIMRVPGFTNWKEPVAECSIVECDPSRVYEWADLLPLIPKRKSESSDGQHHAETIGEAINDGQRNSTIASLTGTMQRRGFTFDAILAAALVENAAKCKPPLPEDEVRSIVKSISRYEPAAQTTPDRPLEIISAVDMVKEFPSLKPVVVDQIARATETTGIVSASKAGKTYLGIDLGLSIATGRMWLNTFSVSHGPVLYIDCELHRNTFARRVAAIAGARGIISSEFTETFDIVSMRGNLRDLYQLAPFFASIENGKYRAIFLDALYRLLPAGIDENSNSDMTLLYNRIDQYAEMTGAAIFIIHHSSKGNQSGKSVTDVGSGAGAQSRAVDSHVVLLQHEQDDVAVMRAAVRSFAPLEPLCLRWTYPTWNPAPEMNPDDLRKEGRRAKKDMSEAPPETAIKWTAAMFVETFITDKPLDQAIVMAKATVAELSDRKAKQLLALSVAEGLAHRWEPPKRTLPVRYATVPQPVTDMGVKP